MTLTGSLGCDEMPIKIQIKVIILHNMVRDKIICFTLEMMVMMTSGGCN